MIESSSLGSRRGRGDSPAAIATSTWAGRRRSRESGSSVLSERAADACGCRVDLALREPEQREPRLRVAAELVRPRIGLLGTGEVALAPPDLADLVVAAAGERALEVLQLVAGRLRLPLRARPVAAQPHRLGAVEPARAGEAGDLQPVAPAVRLLRPLGRTAEVAEVLGGADRDAVDETGRVGPQLAADRRGGRLVQQLEPALDLAALDHPPADPDPGDHLDVTVAEAPCDLDRLFEAREPLRDVPAAEDLADAARQLEEAVLARLGLVGEQPLRVAEPAACDGERLAAGVIPVQRQRDPCGAAPVPAAVKPA